MKFQKIVAPAIALIGISMIVVGCSGPLSSSDDQTNSGSTGSGQHVRGTGTGSGREMRPDGTRRGGRNGMGAMSGSGRMTPPPNGSGTMTPPTGGSGAMIPPDGQGQPPSDGQTPPDKSADNAAPVDGE